MATRLKSETLVNQPRRRPHRTGTTRRLTTAAAVTGQASPRPGTTPPRLVVITNHRRHLDAMTTAEAASVPTVDADQR